ncbi:hypothetical protein Tco_1514579 [Tanacetum coccineum]
MWTAKLRNDILIFQQQHRESLSEAWTRFKDLLQKFPHHGIDRWLQIVDRTHNQQNPEKVLIREEAKFPVTKNVNSISLARGEEERSDKIDVATGNEIEKPTRTETGMQVKEAEKKNEAGKEEMTKIPNSQPIEYYLKHSINEKLIEGLVDNHRIKGMHVFVGNFTYILDFMIVEDISSIIDPRLSQVVLGKPFMEISNMTHDSPEGVVRFTNGTNKVAYMMPHMIEQYNSLLDLEKEHMKSVYLRNEEDKRRGVEYAMRKY